MTRPIPHASQPVMQHCTKDTHRKTSNDVWPLRSADGRTWAERKAAKH